MAHKPFFSRLSALGLEFWLPLPLMAGSVWLGTLLINQHSFQHSYAPTPQLVAQSSQPITLSLEFVVASIDADIDHSTGITEVVIQTLGSPLQELEFEYPLVDYADLERAIAQELGLTVETIRPLIRYHIDY